MEKNSLKGYLFGGIFTAVSLLVGEFWKDAIQETVYSIIPEAEAKKRLWIAYVIAVVFTILSFVILYYVYSKMT